MPPEQSDENFIIEFDSLVYSIEAVKSAIYDLDIAAKIYLNNDIKNIICIEIQLPVYDRPLIKEQICKAVLDHQIRIDVQKEFNPFRKLILAQAFFPCENLGQILDELDS